jgi:hypothetical protein
VARHYAGLLVVPRGVPGQLENLQQQANLNDYYKIPARFEPN